MINSTATQKLTDLLIHLDGAYAPNTLRAYKSDMLEFIEYCIQTNNSALPATPNTIGSFLTQAMGHEIKSSTIRRKVSSISAVHRLSRIYKSLANQAGLSKEAVEGISGHSMRVGGAQDLLSYGASLPQIMVKGGWAKTDTVMRYVERVSPARKLQNRSDLPKMLFLKNWGIIFFFSKR